MGRREDVPSLQLLCTEALATQIIHEDGDRERDDHLMDNISQLPADLFDSLVMHFPPVALHKLQLQMSLHCNGPSSDVFNNVRKRGRYGDFNTAWETLFKRRWPEGVRQIQPVDQLSKQGMEFGLMSDSGGWHQKYWEAHIQNCLDKAAEIAVLPSFDGCIGEIRISDAIMQSIGYSRCMCGKACDYSKLSYQCKQYGCYARCLILRNVLCVPEICDLLKESKLQSVVIRRVKSKGHVDGVCKLLNQNSETLSSLEFIDFQLSSTAMDAICGSIFTKGIQAHGIQYFSIKTSSIGESNLVSVPSGFLLFLSSGRSLCSLNLCDNLLGPNFAKGVFTTCFGASCGLSALDLSENNIAGWLSNFNGGFSSCFGNSLQCLHVLNLRGCNLHKDDATDLRYLLVQVPKLKHLDISDNPIADNGIRNLIPYFVEATERDFSLLDIKIDNCNLSCSGVIPLLKSLSLLKQLNSLSLVDNNLGSEAAVPLAKFLAESCVRVLNIEDIALGSTGFMELCEELPEALNLVDINISKNRGGLETANFVHKLILRAPELITINAGYNFMPSESLVVVCSALKFSKGKLRHLDLTGNTGCYAPDYASMLGEFQFRGRPVVILPSSPSSAAPYDDDP